MSTPLSGLGNGMHFRTVLRIFLTTAFHQVKLTLVIAAIRNVDDLDHGCEGHPEFDASRSVSRGGCLGCRRNPAHGATTTERICACHSAPVTLSIGTHAVGATSRARRSPAPGRASGRSNAC